MRSRVGDTRCAAVFGVETVAALVTAILRTCSRVVNRFRYRLPAGAVPFLSYLRNCVPIRIRRFSISRTVCSMFVGNTFFGRRVPSVVRVALVTALCCACSRVVRRRKRRLPAVSSSPVLRYACCRIRNRACRNRFAASGSLVDASSTFPSVSRIAFVVALVGCRACVVGSCRARSP